jgi:hypothetical protein
MSTNNSQSKGLENPSQCPVFSGTTACEYLAFNETWKTNMRFNNVQDIILTGTHQGAKLREGCLPHACPRSIQNRMPDS